MLVGSFEHTVDEKNRLSIPSAWRKHLEKDGKEIYVTCALERCLFIFSSRQFGETIQKIPRDPFTVDETERDFMRLLSCNTSLVELDKQGRILIPQPLKDHAGIDKEAFLVGMGNWIEVWDKKTWDNFYSQKHGSFKEIAKSVRHHTPLPDK